MLSHRGGGSSEIVRGTGFLLYHRFYRRWLGQANRYHRAAGYFSSSVFQLAFEEYQRFFALGGQMELVCSPHFDAADVEAIVRALERPAAGGPASLANSVETDGRRMLQLAVAHGQLHIRVALLVPGGGNAVYHEKTGVFFLRDGRKVVFHGSANETGNAYRRNFERIELEIIPASEGNPQHVIISDFERLWHNEVRGLEVIDVHQALVRGLLRIESGSSPGAQSTEGSVRMSAPPEILRLPPRLTFRDYQIRAVESWFASGGRGMFAMATGSGKTMTAMRLLAELYQRFGPPLVVVVVVPYRVLVEQWIDVAREFGLAPLNCSGASSSWRTDADAALYSVHSKQRPLLTLVTTNDTFRRDHFQALLSRVNVRTVLIADEVHHMGARQLASKLPRRITLRLGLSATPERWLDPAGNAALQEYFGNKIFEFGLADALRHDPPLLTPYKYFPILVELDDEEMEEYVQLTKALGRMIRNIDETEMSQAALMLLIKRARLLGTVRAKLPALEQLLLRHRNTCFNLIYCGDGQVEYDGEGWDLDDDDHSRLQRQCGAVRDLLNRLSMSSALYVASEDRASRELALRRFKTGENQALVAIRCLDEGVDIPDARRAFILASTVNPRQFIQRRGRLLRKAEGKEFAEIYDFVPVPPADIDLFDPAIHRTFRSLLEHEMRRVSEFAQLATNGPQAREDLLPVFRSFELLHLL